VGINPYAIPPLISAALIFSAGCVTLRKNHKASLNRIFFALCCATTPWLSFYGINYQLTTTGYPSYLINFHYRVAYCGVAFISIIMFHYVVAFLDLKWAKTWNIINYIYGAIVSVLILKTNLIINGVYQFFWGLYPQAGPLHPYFLSYFISLIIISSIFLYKGLSYTRENFTKFNQIKYVLLAFSIFDLASVDFIPNYGIELYPIGYIPALMFIFIIAYAIVKYQLMDINIVIKKSMVYSVLVISITTIFLMIVITSEHFLAGLFGYKNLISSLVAAFLISLIFIPLRNKIQTLIDRLVLKGSPIEIAEQNVFLRQEVIEKEKFRTVATLASSLVHEIKNPLTTLKTFLEHFPTKKDNPEFIAKFEYLTAQEINRMENLVKRLLDFAKPSILSLEQVNIHHLIDDTLTLLHHELRQKGILIVKDYGTALAMLKLDSNQIRQALLNLLRNAIDAMPNGGKLTIETKDKKSTALEVVVTDTGCGIPAADLPHIFEPFFSKKKDGTGLGLSITKDIIEGHKGKIEAKSALGQGTQFIITLPVNS